MLLLSVFERPGAFAQEASPCSGALPEAEQQYVRGAFDAVITLLTPCLSGEELSEDEAVGAYRLLALSYIKKGELEEAKVAVLELLNRKPDYEPDPVQDLPSYTALVNVVKQQLTLAAAQAPPSEEAEEPPVQVVEPVRRRSWFAANRGWVIAGGSVALAGIVAIAASGGGDGGGGGTGTLPPLPLPPGLPTN